MLNDSQRRRLGQKGNDIGRHLLKQVSVLFSPDTVLFWFRKLIAQKYDSSQRRKGGRKRTSKELADLIVRVARNNPSWGYDKIRGVVEYLGPWPQDKDSKITEFQRLGGLAEVVPASKKAA